MEEARSVGLCIFDDKKTECLPAAAVSKNESETDANFVKSLSSIHFLLSKDTNHKNSTKGQEHQRILLFQTETQGPIGCFLPSLEHSELIARTLSIN